MAHSVVTSESSIRLLGLKPEVRKQLKRLGAHTVGQLVNCTESDLIKLGVDNASLKNIADCLVLHTVKLLKKTTPTSSDLTEPQVVEGPEVSDTGENEPAAAQAVASDAASLGENASSKESSESTATPDDVTARTKFNRRPRNRRGPSDVDRVEASLTRLQNAAQRRAGLPRRDDPRVIALRDTLTLSVDDAAFLYNISRDALYDACKNPNSNFPHRRIGRRVVIATRRVFQDLGLD